MSPKEKAIELYNKYFSMITIESPIDRVSSIPYVKQCTLIAVDEILEDNRISYMILGVGISKYYWEEVKKEIEKL